MLGCSGATVDAPMQAAGSEGDAGIDCSGLMHRLAPGLARNTSGAAGRDVRGSGLRRGRCREKPDSVVKPVSYEGKPLVALSELVGAYVRVARLEIDFSMVVLPPAAGPTDN